MHCEVVEVEKCAFGKQNGSLSVWCNVGDGGDTVVVGGLDFVVLDCDVPAILGMDFLT